MHIAKMTEKHMEDCIDLFIAVFSQEPWNDSFDSRKQVEDFFRSHMRSRDFVGFVLESEGEIAALSLGMRKPWIGGTEYYIDQFCVKTALQGQGTGSSFLRLIEEEIRRDGMNALILHTEKGFPSKHFYEKNGFCAFPELVILAKEL